MHLVYTISHNQDAFTVTNASCLGYFSTLGCIGIFKCILINK